MIQDVYAVVWKEWREFVAQPGGWTMTSGWRSNLVIALIVGVWFAVSHDPQGWGLLGLPVVLSIIMSIPYSPDVFAGERERHTLEPLLATRLPESALFTAKVVSIAVYSWALAMICLVAASVTATVREGVSNLSIPIVGAAVVLSLLVAILMGTIGALVSAQSKTAKQAQQTLVSLLFVVGASPGLAAALAYILIVAPRTGPLPRWMISAVQSFSALGPGMWFLCGTVVLLVLNYALFTVGLARFRRQDGFARPASGTGPSR